MTQLQGDTIWIHFSNTTHKGTSDFQIEVLEFISLPKNSETETETIRGKTLDKHMLSPTRTEYHSIYFWGRIQQFKTLLYYKPFNLQAWHFKPYNRVMPFFTLPYLGEYLDKQIHQEIHNSHQRIMTNNS